MEMVMLKRILAFKNFLMKMLMAGSTDNEIHPQIRFRYLLGVSVLKSCYVSDLKLNILVFSQIPESGGFGQNTIEAYNFNLEQYFLAA